MEIYQDFKELLELFNKHKVAYLVVGGYALAFHGAPRFTGDIDILLRPDTNNASNVINALSEFGFRDIGLTKEDFDSPGKVIQLGVPPVRIDLLTSLTGVTWETAYPHKTKGTFGGVQVFFIGLKEFITNKKATGRKKDLADLEALGSAD